jgi:pimeloyl-ACP methyl ester carboxylesterase
MTRFASVPGVRLAYEVAGAGDPPLVFVHGWCCDRSYFAPQVRHFSAGHAVAAVDLRGHGESDRPAPGPGVYDIAVLAEDVLAVAAAAGLGRPVLVGHSLGALVGLVGAARPLAIRALVMVDPAPITNEQAKAFFRDSVVGQTVGSGHFIQLEVPDQVNAMIERFLAITDLSARQ